MEVVEGRKPRQKRAIERVALILDTAVEMILETDINALKLNELADRANIPVGSVYQYFPSRTAIIKRLMDDEFERIREISRQRYTLVTNEEEFVHCLLDGINDVYKMTSANPVLLELWAGSQADALIRHLHDEDNVYHANLLLETALRVLPDASEDELKNQCLLCSVLVDSVVRLATKMDAKEGKALANECARMAVREFGLSHYL